MKEPDLNLLRIFDIVYTTGGINVAADRLSMTPSAVSQAITRLSQYIGESLFVREGRGITPTSAGTTLYQSITPHLQFLEQSMRSERHFDPASSDRIFYVGSNPNYDIRHMKVINNYLRENAPNIRIIWESDLFHEDKRHEALRSRSIDMVLASVPIDVYGYQDEIIASDKLVAVCAKDHPRIGDSLDFETFYAERHTALTSGRMGTYFVNTLAQKGLSARETIYKSDSLLTQMTLVANSDWICICSEWFAETYCLTLGLKAFPLPFDTQQLPLYLSWHNSREDDAGIQWLINVFKMAYDPNSLN
nr:LysR substrate-binding domain-containing protein [Endozoicomonas sp.]